MPSYIFKEKMAVFLKRNLNRHEEKAIAYNLRIPAEDMCSYRKMLEDMEKLINTHNED